MLAANYCFTDHYLASSRLQQNLLAFGASAEMTPGTRGMAWSGDEALGTEALRGEQILPSKWKEPVKTNQPIKIVYHFNYSGKQFNN